MNPGYVTLKSGTLYICHHVIQEINGGNVVDMTTEMVAMPEITVLDIF